MIVKIRKGRHYSNKLPRIFRAKNAFKLKYSIVFMQSCHYYIDEKSCVNKLFGFTDGLFNVHKNSERFGWTFDTEKSNIVIWRYSYIKGILNKQEIFKTNINKENRFELRLNNKGEKFEITYMINDLIKYKGLTSISPKCLFYELIPYFGGNSVAPHEVKIDMI